MESFRNLIRGWFGKLLLVLFLALFALVGMESYFSGGQSADAAATVNGQVISKKDLDNQTKYIKDQYLKYVNGDETLLNLPFIEKFALDSLVARAVLQDQAKTLGIALSDAQITQMFAQLPELQEGGKFSEEKFNQYLAQRGMSGPAFINSVRQDHAIKMLQGTVLNYALVSKQDLADIINLQGEKRDLFLASVKLDAFKDSIQVSDAEISAYYNKHKAQFKQPARVDVDYVVLTPALVNQQAVAVSEDELKLAYAQLVEKNQKNAQLDVKQILIGTESRTPEQAQALANEVYTKIKAGMSFADAAKQYSDDPVSKSKGGEISYAEGSFGSEFDAAVKASKGQVLKPVKTQFGYHLILANSATAAAPDFESVKDRLTTELKAAKQANAFSDAVGRINDTVVNNDDLNVVVEQVKGAKIESVKGFTLSSTHPVLSDPNVKIKLFNDDVKNGDQNTSSNIQLANGDTVWVKVRHYQAAGEQTLAQVKAKVQQKVINQKALEAAKAKIANILAEFKTQPAQQVAAKSGLSFEHAGTFTRSQGLRPEIERTAFSLAAPAEGKWSVSTAAMGNEMIVVAVAKVEKAAVNSLAPEQQLQLAKMYQRQRGEQLMSDYTDYLKSKAKIKE
ncbi:SurA N-terminal domain-containing protein [Acinetobacter rudis]|uniref:SurA N-terminal domain-containing protein n=1 Tax=Acinetobacter rudis TaxID=632955 RepID=UPI00280E1FCF|nr:SurA N-terminal domain-containing protein [Acinetobacter rudis]MDQ8953876.1 SurA N-terminal domain-containing protein [Acinetobacter rudis]